MGQQSEFVEAGKDRLEQSALDLDGVAGDAVGNLEARVDISRNDALECDTLMKSVLPFLEEEQREPGSGTVLLGLPCGRERVGLAVSTDRAWEYRWRWVRR